MYARGHERGTRRQTRQASTWYDAIADATLARLEATWPESHPERQEGMPIDLTQTPGSMHQASGTTAHAARSSDHASIQP